MISRESDLITTKQEESNNNSTSDGLKLTKPSSSSTTSSWSRLKDPRIVRVSRAFGGKDRHSKVCTVRGLRDRRVRLSVPTAIQLYDLQDRLGLNQPSKVVDWLLNAAKHEIDELPPLQIPQGSLINQNLQPFLDSQAAKQGLKINNDTWGKSKDLFLGETSESREENWARSSDQEFQENQQGAYNNFSSNNFISRSQNNHPNLTPNHLLNSSTNSGVSYNSFVRWDPSNLTLSQPQRSHLVQPNFSLSSLQSTPPFLVYQHGGGSTQNYFPSQQIVPMDSEFALKQLNFQSSAMTTSHVDSTTQAVRPFQFGMTADLLTRSGKDKDDEFH